MGDEEVEAFIDWAGGDGKSHRTEVRKLLASLRTAAQRQRARDLLERCGLPVENLSKKQLDSVVIEMSLIFFKGLKLENTRLEMIFSTVAASCASLDKTDLWFAFDIPLAEQRSYRDFYADCEQGLVKRRGVKDQGEETNRILYFRNK